MIRANRPIRSRMDYYAASADPGRLSIGQAAPSMASIGYWRSQRSIDEMRRRPGALSTGYGNLRPVGWAQPYVSGIGKPAIEREDIETTPHAYSDEDSQEKYWDHQGIQGDDHGQYLRAETRPIGK